MRNAVWISFGIALVFVNLIAEIGEYFTGIHIHMLLRIALILGVTMGAFVLSGAITLVHKMDEEEGHRDSCGKARDFLPHPVGW